MSKYTFNNEVVSKFADDVAKVKQHLSVDSNGIITEAEKTAAYTAILPEGLSKKDVEAVRQQDAHYLKVMDVAQGELAVDHLKTHKDAEKVTGSFDAIGGAKVQSTIFREKTYTNNFAKEGEDKTITKHLVVSTKAEFVSTRGIGSIRDAMSKEAKAHIAK